MATSEPNPPPPGSSIVAREEGGDLIIEVPPRGLWRGSYGLFTIACAWCTIQALFATLTIFSKDDLLAQPRGAIWGVMAVLFASSCAGIGLLVAAIQIGRRSVGLAVSRGQLSVVQIGGVFGRKEKTWSRDELHGVRVGLSHVAVNHRQLRELQITSREGKKYGLLIGRDEQELNWLATRIALALGWSLPEVRGLVVGDVDAPPPDSAVVCRELEGGLRLSIPPAGLLRGSYWIFPFGIAWCLLVPLVAGLVVFFGQAMSREFWPFFWIALAGNLLVGIGLVLLGAHLGTRQAEIAVASGRMLVLHQGFLANWRREWSRADLLALRVGESNTTVNNEKLVQLQILPRRGRPVMLFTGRDKQELAWIATLLRRALELPAEVPAPPEKSESDRPGAQPA